MGVDGFTVAIGTCGDSYWHRLAEARAVPSARALGVPVIHHHVDSPAGLDVARNEALAQVHTPWVVQLDADDELEPGYVDAMATGTADVRAPAVRYIRPSGMASPPYVPRVAGHHHECAADCLMAGNWVVIGAAVRTDLLRKVGGWRDYPLYEDFDLWVRVWQAGATFEAIPAAVYRAHVRRDSRNRAPGRAARLAAHRAIATANGLPLP